MIATKQRNLRWYFLYIIVAALIGKANAAFNDTTSVVYPRSAYEAGQEPLTEISLYGGSDDDFGKPDYPPPGIPYSMVWLVPVLQYLLTTDQGGQLSITPGSQLLQVLVLGGSWWFADNQAEIIAKQNGYAPNGTPFPANAHTSHPVPMLEAPKPKIPSTGGWNTGSGEGGNTGSGGGGRKGEGNNPPPRPEGHRIIRIHPAPEANLLLKTIHQKARSQNRVWVNMLSQKK